MGGFVSSLWVIKSAIAFAILPSITLNFSLYVMLASVVACVKDYWLSVVTLGTFPGLCHSL